MTTARDVCTIEVVATGRETTVADAAKLMRAHHVGSLVVIDEGGGGKRPVGIVTDRDMVMEVLALDGDPYVLTVADVMVADIATVREDEAPREALALMRHKGVRRLPVVNARGHLIGILTSDDLAVVLAQDMVALAAISPRGQFRESAQRKPATE